MATDGPKAPTGKWIVIHGIHSGTLTSRDVGEPTEHDSPAAARAAFAKAKIEYASMGYVTWFAHMYDDQGTMTVLDTPRPYH